MKVWGYDLGSRPSGLSSCWTSVQSCLTPEIHWLKSNLFPSVSDAQSMTIDGNSIAGNIPRFMSLSSGLLEILTLKIIGVPYKELGRSITEEKIKIDFENKAVTTRLTLTDLGTSTRSHLSALHWLLLVPWNIYHLYTRCHATKSPRARSTSHESNCCIPSPNIMWAGNWPRWPKGVGVEASCLYQLWADAEDLDPTGTKLHHETCYKDYHPLSTPDIPCSHRYSSTEILDACVDKARWLSFSYKRRRKLCQV